MKFTVSYLETRWHLFSVLLLLFGNVIMFVPVVYSQNTPYPSRKCVPARHGCPGADVVGRPSAFCSVNNYNVCSGNCSGTKTSFWISGQCSIIDPESNCTVFPDSKPIYESTLKCGYKDGQCGCWGYWIPNNPLQYTPIFDCK